MRIVLWAEAPRVARRYPYPVDILSERELIELAKEKANANH